VGKRRHLLYNMTVQVTVIVLRKIYEVCRAIVVDCDVDSR
jgi:hypothetical protein